MSTQSTKKSIKLGSNYGLTAATSSSAGKRIYSYCQNSSNTTADCYNQFLYGYSQTNVQNSQTNVQTDGSSYCGCELLGVGDTCMNNWGVQYVAYCDGTTPSIVYSLNFGNCISDASTSSTASSALNWYYGLDPDLPDNPTYNGSASDMPNYDNYNLIGNYFFNITNAYISVYENNYVFISPFTCGSSNYPQGPINPVYC